MTNEKKETIIELLNKHFNDALFCTRVWSAWSYGTMTEDDFVNIDEEGQFEEFADELLKMLESEKQPEPLSLEQLADAWRNGDPVYAKCPGGNPMWMRKGGVWCVLDGREVAGNGFQLLAVFGHNLTLAQSDYGKTWLAYATKPKGDDADE